MNNSVLLDNWSFQDIGALFAHGYDAKQVAMLVATENGHDYRSAAHGDLQLRALYGLITNAVLRDTLRLDHDFTNHWEQYSTVFQPLNDERLFIVSTPLIEGKDIREGRQQFLKELCPTDSLKQLQAENEAHFAIHKQSAHVYEGQIMWGGAGMLARADAYGIPYVGHPCRQHFFASIKAWRPDRDIMQEVVDIVDSHKTSIYTAVHGDRSIRRAKLILPSVAVEAIMMSSRPEDLFLSTLELRHKYKRIREWIGEIRDAFEQEDTNKVASYKKTLHALAKDVGRMTESSEDGLSIDVTVGWPTVSISLGELVNAIRRRFSLRHDLLKLIKGPSGEQAERKLRSWFA